MKKILILGGSGFIGNNLGRHLAAAYQIYSYDIAAPKSKDERITYIQGDFFDKDDLSNVIQGMDIVIHAVSTINPGNSEQWYIQGYENDLIQTVYLCELLAKQRTKMIFISSGGTVYGNQKNQPIPEDAPTDPINHYGNVKRAIESSIQIFSKQRGLPYIIVRIANPYGIGQDSAKGVGFIDAAIKRFRNGETLQIWGDGETVRDYVHIDDVCGMLQVLIDQSNASGIYNICTGIGTSQKQILHIIRANGLDGNVEFCRPRSVDLKKVILDNSKISALYQKEIMHIEDGIRSYMNLLME